MAYRSDSLVSDYSVDDTLLPRAPCNSFMSTNSFRSESQYTSSSGMSSMYCSTSDSDMDMPPPTDVFFTPRRQQPRMSTYRACSPVKPYGLISTPTSGVCQSVPRSSRSRVHGSVRSSTPMGIRTVLRTQPSYASSAVSTPSRSLSRCLTNGSFQYTPTCASDMSSVANSSVYETSISTTTSRSIYSSSKKSRHSSRRSNSICAKKCRDKRATSSRKTVSSDSGLDDNSSITSSSYSSSSRSTGDSCLGTPRRSSKARRSFKYSDRSCDNSDIMCTPLGARPECIGKEDSPLLHRFLQDVENSFTQQFNSMNNDNDTTVDTTVIADSCNESEVSTPINSFNPTSQQPANPCLFNPEMYMIKNKSEASLAKLNFTVLDNEWDNSDLDATCTTCRTGYNVSESRVDSSSIVEYSSSVLYSDASYTTNNSSLCNNYSSSVPSSVSSCYNSSSTSTMHSGMTEFSIKSDMTNFMGKAINKPAVSSVIGKEKKKSLSKKLKQVGRYIHKLGHRSSKSKFTTLAVL